MKNTLKPILAISGLFVLSVGLMLALLIADFPANKSAVVVSANYKRGC